MRTALARTDRYTSGAIWFHWIIAVLVIVNLVIGLFHESVPALRAWMGAHKAIGITVLVLTLGRIAWRLGHRPPPLPDHVSAGERVVVKSVRWIFYALMLLMPLTGWAMVSYQPRRPLDWFGLFDIPFLPVNEATSTAGDQLHLVLGYLFAALVLLHIAGALRHQFVLRDAVLGRMLPGVAPRG